MGVAGPSRTRHLRLDDLAVNVRLARRLPSVVARRYHALPIAEDHGRVTVAMADPDDEAARNAVTAALGTGVSPCVVGCDPMAVDALLAQVWPEDPPHSQRLLVCTHGSPSADKISVFAHALGGLLNVHVSFFCPEEGKEADLAAVGRVVEQNGYDLVIWGEPEQTLGRRLISGPAYRNAIKGIDCSLLIVGESRWPLKSLLLVVRGQQIDDVAVDWTVRLARPSGAAVTVLAVVPPMPAMYSGFARMQHQLDALLTTETALGKQMRRMAQWLVDWELEGTLRLRQGPLDGQICHEIAEGDYDLITVAARPHTWTTRWWLGNRVTSLLRWADRPVLIAKPKSE